MNITNKICKYIIVALMSIVAIARLAVFICIAMIMLILPYTPDYSNQPSPPDFADEPVNTRGNTTGNIANGSIVAVQGGWIYYSRELLLAKSELFKVREDGSYRTRLTYTRSGTIKELNVVGDWVYYTDYHTLNKIRTDGTGKKQLLDWSADDVTVIGDWIYYFASLDADGGHGIYRIRTDGFENTQLNNENCRHLNVDEGWIYYLSQINLGDAGYEEHIYKIRTDGSGKTLIYSGDTGNMTVDGDWIYYINTNDNNRLYRIRTDGTENTLIASDYVKSVNVSDGWIYCLQRDDSNHTDCIQKFRTDGTDKIKISDGLYKYVLNVAGDWVYFQRLREQKIYRIRTDGTDLQLLE